jgi:hypothetical protein
MTIHHKLKKLKIHATVGGSRFVELVHHNLASSLEIYRCTRMDVPQEASSDSVRMYVTDGSLNPAFIPNVDIVVVGRYDLSINHIKAVFQQSRPHCAVIGLGLARVEVAIELIFRHLVDGAKTEFIEESLVARLNEVESDYLSCLAHGLSDQESTVGMNLSLINIKKTRVALARKMRLSDASRESIIRHIGERHWLLPAFKPDSSYGFHDLNRSSVGAAVFDR